MASVYYEGTSGSTYYAKPRPTSSSPSWAADVVVGTENGTTGEFTFSLDTTKSYRFYEQAGASPASSDPIDGWFDAESASDGVAEAVLAGLSAVEPRRVSMYDPRTGVIRFVQGNDLNATSGTQIDVPINLPSGVDGDACTVRFGAVSKEDTAQRIDATVSLVELASIWHVRLELASALSSDLDPGDYDWEALVIETSSSRQITVVRGTLDLLESVASAA